MNLGIMNKKLGENNLANDTDTLVKSRPCRMKRQKKFFDEIERETATRSLTSKKSKCTINSSSSKELAASNHVKKTSLCKSQKRSMEYADDDQWLEALCRGEMYDGDCVSPKTCHADPSPLTARQRTESDASSLIFNHQDEQGDCEVVISENEEKMQQATRKESDCKRQNIKPSNTTSGNESKSVTHVRSFDRPPMILTLSNRHRTIVSYPPGYPLPSSTTSTKPPPVVRLCSVCRLRPRKYDCSETKAALCSLKCYRLNKATLFDAFPVS